MSPVAGNGTATTQPTGLATDGGNPYAPAGTATSNTYRPSGDTGYTGTTMGQQSNYYADPSSKVDHGGYHTGPTGTSVNPYGYDNSRVGAASNF